MDKDQLKAELRAEQERQAKDNEKASLSPRTARFTMDVLKLAHSEEAAAHGFDDVAQEFRREIGD